jgi:Dyp-type peroxidase family
VASAPVTGGAVALELDDIQGLVARGYGDLPSAGFILASIDEPARANTWLQTLADEVNPASQRSRDHAVHVAFTMAGLSKLGVQGSGADWFSVEFIGGMTATHRRRVLGDMVGNDPGSWDWGGPRTPAIDVLLMLYARGSAEMRELREDHSSRLLAGGIRPIMRLGTRDLDGREHFGFHDGVSQPFVEGLSKTGPASNTVRAGEFVLGYRNEYGLYTTSPLVDAGSDRSGALPAALERPSQRDFGRNGTYLVFRQLLQDVVGFWRYAASAAEAGEQSSVIAVAAKMVGRWPSGAPLVLSPDRDDERRSDDNDFSFHGPDLFGDRCPVGSHIRRANPRDSLDPDPGSEASIAVNKRHRLLRRGRSFGGRIEIAAALSEGEPPEEQRERGLHFICLNANIARQFEFVQHTWLNNPKFGDLYDDPDPLVGATDGPRAFTIQRAPVRRRLPELPSFISIRGGAYFFMPGIRALRYLAALRS